VLSVDRTDYTKGILQRICSIDRFFESNPAYVGEVAFLQICQPTRLGLAAFDKYWEECQVRAYQVNARWATNDWRPLVWIDQPVAPPALSWLYKKAAALLVTPLRDGLNLTAKEFVACGDKDPGALLLSPGAGVWHELGEHALSVKPLLSDQISSQLSLALSMSREERMERSRRMKECLERNTLEDWWHKFTADMELVSPGLASRLQAQSRYGKVAL
jgi:trehalose 6-phosphate synthase